VELRLRALPEPLAICRLPADADVPPWAVTARFFSVTRTEDELSVVCPESVLPKVLPPEIRREAGWRALKIQGPLDFSLTGVLASLVSPLAEAGIPIFALSTFDTDYLLLRAEQLEAVIETLRAAGHRVED